MQMHVQNYQSWSDATISLDGLTVLVGPSTLGKSCFGRALRRSLRNDIPAGHIKLGTSKVEIDVEWGGLELHVERAAKTSASTIYRFGDKVYEKLGGAVPQEIQDMSFGPVEINGVSIDPLFAGQFDTQFMVGSTPAELNAVLKAFACTEKLDRGRKVLGVRVSEINASAKAMMPIISGLEEQEAQLESVLDVAKEPVAFMQALLGKTQRMSKAQKHLQTLDQAHAQGALSTQRLGCLLTLSESLTRTVTLFKALVRVNSLQAAIDNQQTMRMHVNALKGIEGPLKTSSGLSQGTQALQQLQMSRTRTTQTSQKIQALGLITDPLNQSLIRYKAAVRVRAFLAADPEAPRAKAQKIQDLPVKAPQAALAASTVLKGLIKCKEQIVVVQSSLTDLSFEQSSTQQAIIEAETAINDARLSGILVTCPKCKTEFSPLHTHT